MEDWLTGWMGELKNGGTGKWVDKLMDGRRMDVKLHHENPYSHCPDINTLTLVEMTLIIDKVAK